MPLSGAQDPPDRLPAPAPGIPTLLVVDDHEPLRRALVEYFRTVGFMAIEAGTAEEAVAVVERGGVDLVLADVRLDADTGGLELARRLSGQPGPAVLLMTGLPEGSDLDPELSGHDLVRKPFQLPALVDRIRAALARRPEGPGAG